MKNTLLICFIIISFSVFGQIPDKNFDGPIVIFDTLTIKKEDVIYLGKGSDPNTGNFLYITTPENFATHTLVKGILTNPKFYDDKLDFPNTMKHKDFKNLPQGIGKYYNGASFAIERFSKISSKENGDKFLGVIKTKQLHMVLYSQAVDFEAAIESGEIIKINDIDFIKLKNSSIPKNDASKPSTTIKREIEQFSYTKDGVKPIYFVFKDKDKNEIYAKTLNWYRDYYKITQSSIEKIENEEVRIETVKKDFVMGTIFGKEIKLPFPYNYRIGFVGNEIRMSFGFYDPSGNISNDPNKMMLAIFDKKGNTRKGSEKVLIQLNQLMNEISSSLVYYLDNN